MQLNVVIFLLGQSVAGMSSFNVPPKATLRLACLQMAKIGQAAHQRFQSLRIPTHRVWIDIFLNTDGSELPGANSGAISEPPVRSSPFISSNGTSRRRIPGLT
jgi:hypothetical protein